MRIRINYRYYCYLFICFLILPPLGLYSYNTGMYTALACLGGLFSVGIFIIKKAKSVRRGKLQNSIVIMSLYLIWNMSNTVLLTNTFSSIAFRGLCTLLGLYCYLKSEKTNSFIRLRALDNYLAILIVLNFFIQLLLPNGLMIEKAEWQNIYLLGNANSYVFVYLLAITVDQSYNRLTKKKQGIKSYSLIVIELLSFVINREIVSLTGFLCIAVFGFIIVLMNRNLLNRFVQMVSSKAIFVIGIVVVAFILLLQTEYIFVVFEKIGINKGDITNFNSRVYLWRNAISRIMTSPIIGHGTVDGNFATSLTGRARSSHNNYLQILYYSGFIGLSLFLASGITTIINLRKHCNKGNDVYTVYFVGIMLFYLSFLVEQSPYSGEFLSVIALGGFLIDYFRFLNYNQAVNR